MSLIKSKQIDRILSGSIKLLNVTIGAGLNNIIITAPITSVLTTAGNNGVSVPTQTSSNVFTPGVVVTSPINKSEVFDHTTKLPITDINGNEIYGRIIYSGSNYILNLHYLSSGVETPYTTVSSITIDFDFIYRFDFNTLPADALIAVISKNVTLDPKGQGATMMVEKLTVVATNSVSVLGNIPSAPTKTILSINGKEEYTLGASPAFSLAGATVTWNAGNAGYSLETNDIVYVKYYL